MFLFCFVFTRRYYDFAGLGRRIKCYFVRDFPQNLHAIIVFTELLIRYRVSAVHFLG